MASSVCAFAVSPAPATSFISPPLYRTSRQWRCVYSARQQKDPVRRLRKGLARFVVVLADEESDVQLGISRKRPPDSKTNHATAFFDSIGQNAKYSQRADDFRLQPMNGHHQAQTPRPKSADSVAKVPKAA